MTAWYDVVGALGAGVGGLAAMVSAFASWQAAASSRATSRDALEALALAIRPALVGDTRAIPERVGDRRSPWRLHIRNVGAFPAREVTIEAEFADGHRVRGRWERVAPGDEIQLLLREIATPPGGPSAEEAGTSLLVRYSDDRDIARYQVTFGFMKRTASGQPPVLLPSIAAADDPVRIR